ncbi:hypothetical protein TNCV_903281 [Trichonephila clavipes]|nr:hypothetical protein TNCV_903281 [Trichonephila clavipes]
MVRGDKPTPSNLGDDNYSQVSRKSVGLHHGALGNVLIVQVVRQGAVVQIPERGQHFQVELLKNFTLVRSLDDDETSLSQVKKLAPEAERQCRERN